MDSTRPIFVVDYVDTSFDEVCESLADWQDHRVTSEHGRNPIARVGRLDRIADHVARVAMFDDGDRIAELRALAVSTGRDALTELLVFSDPSGRDTAGRAAALLRARSILNRATQRIETSAHHAARNRAS